MRWIIFAVVVLGIAAIFGAVYGISHLRNRSRRPKYKSTAPDDDPKFLRDLAERLKNENKNDPNQNGEGSVE